MELYRSDNFYSVYLSKDLSKEAREKERQDRLSKSGHLSDAAAGAGRGGRREAERRGEGMRVETGGSRGRDEQQTRREGAYEGGVGAVNIRPNYTSNIEDGVNNLVEDARRGTETIHAAQENIENVRNTNLEIASKSYASVTAVATVSTTVATTVVATAAETSTTNSVATPVTAAVTQTPAVVTEAGGTQVAATVAATAVPMTTSVTQTPGCGSKNGLLYSSRYSALFSNTYSYYITRSTKKS